MEWLSKVLPLDDSTTPHSTTSRPAVFFFCTFPRPCRVRLPWGYRTLLCRLDVIQHRALRSSDFPRRWEDGCNPDSTGAAACHPRRQKHYTPKAKSVLT